MDLSDNKSIHSFTITQAMYMAGVDRDDDPWVRDVKFAAWLKKVRGQIVDSVNDQIKPTTEVIITKKEK
jgi:hypothetical protein